jgi:XRE family transcriptional regulator, aerobic/anaerobic benzoate catabolism transcriptional regulator
MDGCRSASFGDAVEMDRGNSVLDRLAERVRTVRSGRGMSRKVLAHHAQVSERYLAQLEAGKGNISIMLLWRIARALGVPLAALVEERERPLDAVLLDTLLERLSPEQWADARNLLLARFAAPPGAKRRDRIALIGLRGGGKSTIGGLLAKRLDAPFVELDREIETTSGMALAQMFEMFGQETFRRAERRTLEAVLRTHDKFVLATGGGLVTEPGTFELLLASCLTVWVRADPEAHMSRVIAQGDLRPMAEGARAMDDLLAILKSREPLYAKADVTLDTAGKMPEETVEQLVNIVARMERSEMRDDAR